MVNERRTGLRAFVAGATIAALAVLIAGLTASPALARHKHWARHSSRHVVLSPTDPSKDAALIVDGETGRQLYARNATALRHPASLTKLMTLYLLFESLKTGKITMTTDMAVSQHAASQPATNLHLSAGDEIPVETAIKAIVVQSANDVAVVIAEALGGTESHFAQMMTAKARELGMRSTYYHNASGLPDPLQITSAEDLSILARHLAYDFPQYFPYFATPSFSFHGRTYVTHDNLLGRFDGADGMKTGYTSGSGFNLVSSVVRDGSLIIGVVMGGRTAHLRDREMVRLLNDTFTRIADNPTLVAHNQVPWNPVTVAAASAPRSAFTPAPQSGTAVAMLSAPDAIPDDEDAAEAETADGNADLGAVDLGAQVRVAVLPKAPASTAPQPPPTSRQLAPVPAVAAHIPAVRPTPKPGEAQPAVAQAHFPIVIAAFHPQPKPKLAGSAEVGQGDISYDDPIGATIAAMNHGDWAIQIGAFGNMSQARAQLAAYAEKSMDVLGQAARIVTPFQSMDGRTLYRARFGPFLEREARQVCSRLSQRGQTCFAVSER